MQKNTFDAKAFMRTLTIVHMALVGGLITFMLFAYFQTGGFVASMDQNDTFIYIVPIVAATGYFGSQFMFKKQLQLVKREDVLQTKLGKYFTASLIKFAFIEGAAFLALFAYFSTQNALHFTIAICLIAYLIVQRPTLPKLDQHLPLNMDEKKNLNI
ncbi:hypothetical protein [Costertonia aggregata]|uniref:Uncharacterized protein n=1 Tax=Costertonia aggregata TaxID=343403 RepID=A0A7H9AVL1_9FLAO|nr:hypothetical protein [Costertonia aggregata]QLG47105.1 hypothetical protein HYG79_17660 [Costertonia aggregata]